MSVKIAIRETTINFADPAPDDQKKNLPLYIKEFKKGNIVSPKVPDKLIPGKMQSAYKDRAHVGFEISNSSLYHGYLTNSAKAVVLWWSYYMSSSAIRVFHTSILHPDIKSTPADKKRGYTYYGIAKLVDRWIGDKETPDKNL